MAYSIQKGRLDPTKPITMKELYQSGTVNFIKLGLNVYGNGGEFMDKIDTPIHLELSDADDDAIEAINSRNGSITIVHHSMSTIQRLIKPHKFIEPMAKIPMPAPSQVMKYEKMKERGLKVRYPVAPWFEEYK